MIKHTLLYEEGSCDGVMRVTDDKFIQEPFNFFEYIERRGCIRMKLAKFRLKPRI